MYSSKYSSKVNGKPFIFNNLLAIRSASAFFSGGAHIPIDNCLCFRSRRITLPRDSRLSLIVNDFSVSQIILVKPLS